ncbi:hypothetical protein [Nocardia sp. NPDC051750]|uniref:hypothetical protein n=1 Tax=Nocardia sp. NPDC051750 TaxID=3364325 RepID=UPI0037B4E05B
MEVYRYGTMLVADAQTRARDYLDGVCEAIETAVIHGELGDAMCVRTREGFGQLVEADIGVQRGADVFRVVYSNQVETADGARSTASEIAQLMMGAIS